MPAKTTIIHTSDKEHWYEDNSELQDRQSVIYLEFNKDHVKITADSDDQLILKVFPNSHLYRIIAAMGKYKLEQEVS